MESSIKEVQEVILSSDNIVFFGGAGLSTESGIPDFRSTDGLYNMEYDYPPETIISASFFRKKPKEFYRFYKNKCLKPMINAKPNYAHLGLKKLEEMGKLKAIITQNIDDLHHKAKSNVIYELHGTSFRNYCVNCHKEYSLEDIMKNDEEVPHCECGGIIRPDIVLYEEMLNEETIKKSIEAISRADVLIVAGTSLVVYPAASFINYYNGNKMILINLTTVSQESMADYVLYKKVGEVFKEIFFVND